MAGMEEFLPQGAGGVESADLALALFDAWLERRRVGEPRVAALGNGPAERRAAYSWRARATGSIIVLGKGTHRLHPSFAVEAAIVRATIEKTHPRPALERCPECGAPKLDGILAADRTIHSCGLITQNTPLQRVRIHPCGARKAATFADGSIPVSGGISVRIADSVAAERGGQAPFQIPSPKKPAIGRILAVAGELAALDVMKERSIDGVAEAHVIRLDELIPTGIPDPTSLGNFQKLVIARLRNEGAILEAEAIRLSSDGERELIQPRVVALDVERQGDLRVPVKTLSKLILTGMLDDVPAQTAKKTKTSRKRTKEEGETKRNDVDALIRALLFVSEEPTGECCKDGTVLFVTPTKAVPTLTSNGQPRSYLRAIRTAALIRLGLAFTRCSIGAGASVVISQDGKPLARLPNSAKTDWTERLVAGSRWGRTVDPSEEELAFSLRFAKTILAKLDGRIAFNPEGDSIRNESGHVKLENAALAEETLELSGGRITLSEALLLLGIRDAAKINVGLGLACLVPILAKNGMNRQSIGIHSFESRNPIVVPIDGRKTERNEAAPSFADGILENARSSRATPRYAAIQAASQGGIVPDTVEGRLRAAVDRKLTVVPKASLEEALAIGLVVPVRASGQAVDSFLSIEHPALIDRSLLVE
jgi:hypothetical protein